MKATANPLTERTVADRRQLLLMLNINHHLAEPRMRHFWIIVLLLTASLLSGCSVLQSGKLLAPENCGLTPVAPRIYVETGADEETRRKLREDMVIAENAIRAAYGCANSRPIVHACITEKCYGRVSVAKVYGDRILLSPRGLNWHFLAHEWSHAEMRSRQTFSA
jgi:hypothetical protein